MIQIPENELEFEFARASGPGGQNVNRRETKVRVRWNIEKTQVLAEEQKEQLRQSSLVQLTIDGDIIVEAQEERIQERNREIAVRKLNDIVNRALEKKKKRISTKPSKSAKERRLDEKKKKSQLKKARQKIKYF